MKAEIGRSADFSPQQRPNGKRAKTEREPLNIRVMLRTKVRAPAAAYKYAIEKLGHGFLGLTRVGRAG